jgi:hypothetical protein
MFSTDEILPASLPPYGLKGAEKTAYLLPKLAGLCQWHRERCPEYRRIIERMFPESTERVPAAIEDLPFIPVSLFKNHRLISIPEADVFKVMTSSGTTGQRVSQIILDRHTAELQARALVRIMQHFLGKNRLPMIILDHPEVIRDRDSFSARGAGILGLMQFGRQPIYALRSDMSLNEEAVREYLAKHEGSPVLYFGFTFMAWQHAIRPLLEAGRRFPANRGVLIHSGGWKRMEHARVSSEEFSRRAIECLGVAQVRNFYGMVEQVGSVFFENDLHLLHAPVFADVIIRDPYTLRPVPDGQTGLIQVLSVLPQSYPGHSLLTEDMGRILGRDDIRAGMPGAFFEVTGRAPRSEIRGCSDTYEPA